MKYEGGFDLLLKKSEKKRVASKFNYLKPKMGEAKEGVCDVHLLPLFTSLFLPGGSLDTSCKLKSVHKQYSNF